MKYKWPCLDPAVCSAKAKAKLLALKKNPVAYAAYLKKKREYQHARKDKNLARVNERYRTDRKFRELCKARAKAYRMENPELCKARSKDYRRRNRVELDRKSNEWYYANLERAKKRRAIYRKRTRLKTRVQSRLRSQEVTEGYAREQLSKYSPLSASAWPRELVLAKIETIRLKRVLKTR